MNAASQRRPLPGFRLAAVAVVLAITVVILGAFTRLVDAGLGCPDWPGCYGHLLWPMSDSEVAAANAAFPETPVEHDKTWPEQVHRIFAASLGVFCIALLLMAWRHRELQSPLKHPLFLLGLIIVQGIFGYWTVSKNLWPTVVLLHLLGGFTTLSLLWLLCLRLQRQQWVVHPLHLIQLQSLKPHMLIALLALIMQIALGGWTSANYAALACPDLPLCQAQWWPAMDFAQGFNVLQDVGPNYLGGQLDSSARTAIHLTHRVGALVASVVLLSLIWRLWRSAVPAASRLAVVILVLLLVQLALGISNIAFALPLLVAVAHNAGGALLLLAIVTLHHRVYTATPEDGL